MFYKSESLSRIQVVAFLTSAILKSFKTIFGHFTGWKKYRKNSNDFFNCEIFFWANHRMLSNSIINN